MLPLEGILVIALEQAVAGPMCTLRLADAGARVIKIERQGGETARHYDAAVNGTSAYFAALNRGKESCVLNIKEEHDRALLERMIARADVLVRNLAPGAAQRLGLGAGELVERYPRLICVDIYGYGQDTAYAKRLAYDMLVQAEAGMCAVTGTPDEMVKIGVSVADITTGINAHVAILEALLERAITGRGKAIEITMFDSMAELMATPLLLHDHAGREIPRMGLRHNVIAPYGRVRCRDGEVVIACQQNGEWARFCEGVLNRPDLIDDRRFTDNADRVANADQLYALIDDICATFTREELIGRLQASRLPWARVSTLPDLSAHPALHRVDILTPGGPAKSAASPIRRDIKSGVIPALGEHTEAIRREFGAQSPKA